MKLPVRHDYRFPLRVNSSLRQADRANYPDHVKQMIRQFLLTTPGERICLPSFGGGLQALLFAPIDAGLPSAAGLPNTGALPSTAELLIRNGLQNYLSQHISVSRVSVNAPADATAPSTVQIVIEYLLIETQTADTVTVQLI